MRGDVFDGRGFLKSAISGKEADAKSKTKNIDFDVDLKLGAVAGYQWRGAAQRRRQGFPARRRHQEFHADRQGRARHAGDRGFARPRAGAGPRRDHPADQRRRRVLPLHRHLFQDDRWPARTRDGAADGRTSAKEGLINVRDFSIKGEARSSARPRAGRRHSERHRVLAPARRIHPAERTAHDPRRRRQGPDHRRHHRRQHRLYRQLGAHERHLRSDVRAEQHVRPDSRLSACSSAAAAMKA